MLFVTKEIRKQGVPLRSRTIGLFSLVLPQLPWGSHARQVFRRCAPPAFPVAVQPFRLALALLRQARKDSRGRVSCAARIRVWRVCPYALSRTRARFHGPGPAARLRSSATCHSFR